MAVWMRQIQSQVDKHGADKASWHVEWAEPTGARRSKTCGAGKKGKRLAEQLRDRLNAQLTLGTYESDKSTKTSWDAFAERYKKNVLTGIAVNSMLLAEISLGHFRRILKLDTRNMRYITTERIDEFRAVRRTEKGKKPKSIISPATVNRDLRHLKAALRVAVEWKYLDVMPKVKFEREPKKLATFITEADFNRIYNATDKATKPENTPYPVADWWKGLLMFCQMTGWRISEVLALEWRDVDLEAGTAVTRAKDNKSSSDSKVSLHPVVVEHLKRIQSFGERVFPWPHHHRTLYVEFAIIQTAAGIQVQCKDQRPHTCTPACTLYGFHDERRAFATLNAPSMTREALQALMRHASPETTARYINMANQLNPAVAALHVPNTLQAAAGVG